MRTRTLAEKKAAMMAVITVAKSDGEVSLSEIKAVEEVASELGCRLHDRDIKSYDLDKIAAAVTTPEARADIFAAVLRVALADQKLREPEIVVVKHFAEAWAQPLPTVAGVDWNAVATPPPDVRVKISEAKREKVAARVRAVPVLQPPSRGAEVAHYAIVALATAGLSFAIGQFLLGPLVPFVLGADVHGQLKSSTEGLDCLLSVVLHVVAYFVLGFLGIVLPAITAGLGVGYLGGKIAVHFQHESGWASTGLGVVLAIFMSLAPFRQEPVKATVALGVGLILMVAAMACASSVITGRSLARTIRRRSGE